MEVIKDKTEILLAQVSDGRLQLGGLFDGLKVNVDKYKEIIDDFNRLDLKNKKFIDSTTGKFNWDEIAKSIKGCDETALSYFKTLDDGNGTINNQSASVEGLGAHLKATGQSFNFAAIKATLLNTALNAGIFLVASLAIQGIAKALDNYIHRVEKAREHTDKLFDEFKSMNDTLADHRKIVSELANRYDELSKGVNLSTNENVSLSTEEYEEFLNINEQLAKAFPELAKGIDENGNSILTLGTKGVTAKEQLEELLQTEEDLNNFRIAQGLEDAFKGVYTYVEDANKATEKLNGSISDSSEAMGKLQDIAENGIKLTGDNNQLLFSGNTNNQAEFDYMNALTASVNEFWEALDPDRRVYFDPSTLLLQDYNQSTGAFKLYANAYGLTSEELASLENIIRDNVGDASNVLLDSISDQSQELQEQIKKSENAWTDFIPTLVSGMKSKQTFKNLDSDLQNIAVQIVDGLDYSYADAMKEWDPDPYAYVRDKIIDPLSKLDDAGKEKLTSSFEELFKLDADDLSQSNQAEIEKFITTIANLLDKDPIEIRVALGFDVEDVQNRYNTALNKAKHQLGGYDYNDRGVEATNDIGRSIQDFWDENVTTEEDWTLWQKVTDGITDAAEAMNAYAEAKKNANGVEIFDDSFIPTISSSIQQLATQLEPQFAKLGEAYKEIFKIDEKTGKEIFSLDSIDNSMLEGLRQSFAEIEEEVGVIFDASTLDPFFDTLTNSASTADQVQQAFNDLATAYFHSTETLDYLNEETAESIIKQLEEMGVANAQEVVYDALNEKTEELALEKQFLAQTGIDVANATEQDIEKYVTETGASAECAQSLMILALKKAAVNGVLLDTSADITNLLSLAKAAGIASDNLILLANAKSGLALAEKQGNESMVSYYTGKIEELGKKAEEDIFNFDNVKLDFSNVGGGKSNAGSAGKEAADAYLEAFEKELKELDELRDDGIISEKEYLDRLRVLYNKYFKDKAKYLKQYAKYEKQYLNGMKDLYEKAFSHMTSQLDKRKDAINAEKDARLADIEAQKEQYQHEIDLIDEQIKAKNKEIEAIRSAANSRKLENEYMLAQYKLAQMQNQRTNLVYTEEKGMIYRPDLKNIRDAKQDVDDAQMEITISKIEKETELLENQKEMWEEQIDLLDKQAEALEKYYDSMTEAIEEQKSKFEELQELLEEAEMSALLKELGINEEALLSGSTEEFNKLRDAYLGILADLNKGNEGVLNALSELSGVSTLPSYLGDATYSVNELADSTKNLSDNIAGIDSSNVTCALDNTAQSSSNAAEKVQSITTALNSLSNDISNYQMPAVNSDNFTACFEEDGGILSALKGFTERFKEICDEIPLIWDGALAEAFGQGGGNGDPLAGGLANDTKYDALFEPMLEALNNCKTNMEAKLKECLETFTTFQADLSGIIGVGGGGDSEDSGSSQSGAEGGKGKGAGGEKGSGGDKKSESGGGSDTIVGAIVEGGELIDQALNGEEDSWNASFITAAESIHNTATYIVECIESMVETIVNACIAAIDAINMLERVQGGAGNHPTPPPYSRVGHTHGEIGDAFADGTGLNGTTKAEDNAVVSEYGQREMTVFPNGKTVITNSPTAMKMPKGTVVYNEEQTEKILKNKVTATGSAYAKGTSNGNIGEKFVLADGTVLTPVPYDDPVYDVTRKFEAYMEKTGNDIDIIARSGLIRYNNDMGEVVKNVTNVSKVTNNNQRDQVIHQEIYVTLPNVTNATSAESLLRDLESIGRKKYQVNW